MNLSGRALGEALEPPLTEAAVRKAEKAGRISREPDGGYDLEKCRKALAANVNIHQQRRGSPHIHSAARAPESEAKPAEPQSSTPNPPNYYQTQHEIELEKLKDWQRRNAKAAGELLDRASTVEVFAQMGSIYSQGRDALPAQLATQLVGKADLNEIERIIREALVAVDNRIADEIEARFAVLSHGNPDTRDSMAA